MSTSLAVQPAYRSTATERSQANPGRTIFGTTLDDYAKCWTLLNNPKAIQDATDLYKKKLKWKPRSPTPQRIVDRAWGLRDYKQPEIGEEFVRGYSKLQGLELDSPDRISTAGKVKNRTSSRISRESGKLTNYSCQCESACSKRSDVIKEANRSTSPSIKSVKRKGFVKLRPMSEPVRGRRPPGGDIKVRVPRFRLPPGATNFLRTSSMKITETGAKDLLNSQPMNKIGLGDTLQYNYQEFQRQKTPKFYRDNGHVLLLGQKFKDQTTNKEDSAPGGFYNSNPPDRYINERFRYVKDRNSEVTMKHDKGQARRQFTLPRKQESGEEELVEYDIPLNILHKFGEENVSKIFEENQDQLVDAIQKPTELRHSALVPARLNVKELNHPIDPPPTYFTNIGGNLKHDKFEGGLHLYIK